MGHIRPCSIILVTRVRWTPVSRRVHVHATIFEKFGVHVHATFFQNLHGRGMDTKFLGKRGVDMDTDTEFLENCVVDMDMDTEFFEKRGVDMDMDTA